MPLSGSAGLILEAYDERGETVLVLRGELDLEHAHAFEEAVAHTCNGNPTSLLLDISDLDFVDSTGLRAILAAKALCEQRSCAFALTQPTHAVKRLFELTGVLSHLPCRDEHGNGANGALRLRPPADGAVRLWPRLLEQQD